MERYLLFDSGCSLCTELARNIEQESNGWLMARSLRQAKFRSLLDQARPGWRWQPTLLEVEGERVRVATGATLMARLVAGLGPRRTRRLAQHN